MKFKKVMLITLILLAILTMGAVSAEGGSDFNETLTADIDDEVSVDASFDDEIISEDSDYLIASSDDDSIVGVTSEDICYDYQTHESISNGDDEEITVNDFNWWMATHEFKENDWGHIANVGFNDRVNEGTLNLIIEKDGNSDTYSRDIEGPDNIVWELGEIGFIDEYGDYTINLMYSNGDEIYLVENHVFRLTELNYGLCEYVYVKYPFDVIRFYSQEDDEGESTYIKVHVDGVEKGYGGENPFRWNLYDLGIDGAGEYTIDIESYRGENPIEEFTYTLNVDDDLDYIRFYSNELGPEIWELDNPVVYLVCPSEMLGQHLKLYVFDELVDEFEAESSMSWILDDLGIDHNDGYQIRLCIENEGEEDEIADTWLNVWSIISQDCFNWWIPTHESIENDEITICEVWMNGVGEGSLILTVESPDGVIQTIEESIDGRDNIRWDLRDFDNVEGVGTYTINLTYSNGDELSLAENHAFTLTKLNYNICECVYVEYPFDVIRFYCEDNDGVPIYDVKVQVNGDEKESGGDNPFRWTLVDLGIRDAGEYTISIKVFKGEKSIEDFTYTLYVDDNLDNIVLYSNELGPEYWEFENPVLYLICPEEMCGQHLTMDKDDNYFCDFDAESIMSWTLEDLEIYYDGNHEIRIYNDDDDQLADAWINVWTLNQFKVCAWIWDTDEKGELYNDIDDKIIHVEIPEDKSGNISIIINGVEAINWQIDDTYHEWHLDDLGMENVDEYDITVRYLYDEEEEIIGEATLNVVEFNNDAFRAIINSDNRCIDFYCPDGENGEIKITVEKEDDEYELYYTIDDTYWDEWTKFYFSDLQVSITDYFRIRFEVDDVYSCEKEIFRWGEVIIWNGEDERGPLYNDNQGDVILIKFFDEGRPGTLYLLLDGEVKFISKLSLNHDYSWNLRQLNISGTKDLELRFIFDEYTVESIFDELRVQSFDGDSVRASLDLKNWMVNVFCLEDCQTIEINIFNEEEGEYLEPVTYDIVPDDYGKWKGFSLEDMGLDDWTAYTIEVNVDDAYSFKQMFRLGGYEDEGPGINIGDGRDLINDYDDVFTVCIPVEFGLENATINITSGNYSFYKNIEEIDPRWDNGYYLYDILLGDLDSFATLEDKAIITATLRYMDYANNETYYAKDSRDFILQKTDSMRIYDKSVMDDDWIFVDTAEMHEEKMVFNITSDGDNIFASVTVPEIVLDNVSDGKVCIYCDDNLIFEKLLDDFDSEHMGYDYPSLANIYFVYFKELDLANAKDKDLVRIEFITQYDDIENREVVYHIVDEDIVEFYDCAEGLSIADDEDYLGNIENFTYITKVTIPEELDSTGYFSIVCGDKILFNKTLDEIMQDYDDNKHYSYYVRGYFYYIPKGNLLDDLHDGDIIALSLVYDGEEQDYFEEKIFENSTGKYLKAIISPKDIDDKFGINITDKILINLENGVLNLFSFDGTNRQTIDRKLRSGYFNVYVNGVKVENLGKLLTIDEGSAPITELELFWLCENVNRDFNLTLDDLGIIDNGEYDIRVTYVPEISDPDQLTYRDYTEMNVTNLNITLTSNVKVNYQNATTRLFTGYGIDPVLLYLDTYYGDINSTNGTVTVLNSDNATILNKNIKDLKYDNGRYYLSYSDFENKNFGDSITVLYGNGNERSGETTLDVLWKDVDSNDFTPNVTKNVEDYYGNFVNLNIPDSINTGQIIVTIKFKNNHGSNISNINVNTDFNSRAVYKFNVVDIKANYDNNDFALSLSDLGFYEINGDYDVDVKFTADGVNALDVTSNTLKVEFLDDIIIAVNESSRYACELPFAGVRVFEPISAYGELYIDGVLYSHKTFEKGLITFVSSASWAPGMHAAEVRVCDSEFGSVLNSTAFTFETLIKTDDVNVSMDDKVKENENVIVTINVIKAGNVTVQIDNGDKKTYTLVAGENAVDLGVLSYGNHTVWISYNATLDDSSISFYNNYLTLFVGDDGRWLSLPEPLVLDDDDTIKMAFGDDAEGVVSIAIDGKSVANITLVNGSAEFALTDFVFGDHKYGEHTYNITYSGDATHDSLSKSGVFNVTYIFKDNLVKEGFPLREYYIIIIILPADATGSVTITVEGNEYTSPVKDGQAEFKVDDLEMGEHEVIVSYTGDSTYPANSYKNVLNVSYYAVVGEISDNEKWVSLMLPANATGNLTVYNDNRGSKVASKALVNGKATIDLSDVSVGIYEIRAVYEGSDYDAKIFKDTFKMMPDVYITQDVVMGDNVTVFMDLDDSTGSIVIVRDGLNPVVWEIVDGKINYTFSTEGYSYGNHTVNFLYFGKSFDGDLFVEDDGKTPVKYALNILPKETTSNAQSDDDNYLVVYIYDDEGNIAYDAHGSITFFIDGAKGPVIDIVNGIARLDLSQFKNGAYLISWTYSGDAKYGSSSNRLALTINHKTARISASDLTVLYSAGKKYSVTVYKADGSPASGEKVSFLLNNKAYATATTNSKGVASIVIKSVPGTYKITSSALGVSLTKNLKVKHVVSLKKVKVKKSAKKLVLTATLKKVNGKYLKKKTVTFRFNGKKYKAKTNKKGVAKYTIKSKVLKKLKVGKKVKYQVTYKKDTVKRTVKVKK